MLNKQGYLTASIDAIEAIKILAKRSQKTPVLDVRGKTLSRIPKEIEEINGLEELYLGENGLSELPEAIGRIETLKVLSLGKNKISRLPKSLIERWGTLQKLFLGDNQITELSFTEDDLWAFQHGSIGSNPLPEPIGRCWMVREDALKLPVIMKEMVPPKLSSRIAKELSDQLILVLELSGEPMIYECLYRDIILQEDGTVLWNEHFDRPWLRYIAAALLPNITRGSMIDQSLWAWNIEQLSVVDLPEIPVQLKMMANVQLLQ